MQNVENLRWAVFQSIDQSFIRFCLELGMYLVSRGAYKIAESQFRRAIWLNHFVYRFVLHLAWCLYKQGRLDEAKAIQKKSILTTKILMKKQEQSLLQLEKTI